MLLPTKTPLPLQLCPYTTSQNYPLVFITSLLAFLVYLEVVTADVLYIQSVNDPFSPSAKGDDLNGGQWQNYQLLGMDLGGDPCFDI